MKIYITSVFVDGQSKAHDFYARAWVDAGPARMAVLDDTCGNLIQLLQMKSA